MYTLYSIPGSCSTGIHVLLKSLGQDVDIVHRDEVSDYRSLVPTNQVPALSDGKRLLTEGAAIGLYLLEKHLGDSSPSQDHRKTEFRQWLMFNYATLHPAYSKLYSVANVMDKSPEKQALLQRLADRVSDTWSVIDQHLATRRYVVGATPTLLDYLLALYVNWGNSFPDLHIEPGANVLRLVAEVRGLPEFESAWRAEGLDRPVAA